jgi:hypothetical protein
MTGLTRQCFGMLLAHLFDLEAIARLHSRQRGWPQSLCSEGYLGLLLFYLGSTMNNKHVCLIFGVTPAVCSWAISTML